MPTLQTKEGIEKDRRDITFLNKEPLVNILRREKYCILTVLKRISITLLYFKYTYYD